MTAGQGEWWNAVAGTYNNQYIVVDLKKFTPGSELQPGLLTIVEQMPGLVVSGDETQVKLWPDSGNPKHATCLNGLLQMLKGAWHPHVLIGGTCTIENNSKLN